MLFLSKFGLFDSNELWQFEINDGQSLSPPTEALLNNERSIAIHCANGEMLACGKIVEITGDAVWQSVIFSFVFVIVCMLF